jgi:cysteine desulfurase family protein (TIGR01976 family)
MARERRGGRALSTVAFDVAAVRARFSALDRPIAFFDAPGGTQTPDSVIDAMVRYLRESNANLGGPFETSRRSDALVVSAHHTAARFLGCDPDEVGFGPNMTTLNFALTRTLGRELRAGDEVIVTRLDHDGNISPWLHLADDLDLLVRFVDLNEDDATLDIADLERQLSERTRVVAFPLASNAVGTVTEARRIVAIAHEAGALAWVDAVHYAPHLPIDVRELDADVLLCSPYKFFGPHLGLFYGRRELLERLQPYKVRPAPDEPVSTRFETGTLPHEALAGFNAAVAYVESVGWEGIAAHERELGERLLGGLPDDLRLYGPSAMEGRVATFAVTVPGLSSEQAATRLAERGLAVWWGDYYAVEVMRRLGLPDGALRLGIIHYNTAEEVDRLLAALHDLL